MQYVPLDPTSTAAVVVTFLAVGGVAYLILIFGFALNLCPLSFFSLFLNIVMVVVNPSPLVAALHLIVFL